MLIIFITASDYNNIVVTNIINPFTQFSYYYSKYALNISLAYA